MRRAATVWSLKQVTGEPRETETLMTCICAPTLIFITTTAR